MTIELDRNTFGELPIPPAVEDDQIALEVPYNNGDTNLNSTNVQGALDELDGRPPQPHGIKSLGV